MLTYLRRRVQFTTGYQRNSVRYLVSAFTVSNAGNCRQMYRAVLKGMLVTRFDTMVHILLKMSKWLWLWKGHNLQHKGQKTSLEAKANDHHPYSVVCLISTATASLISLLQYNLSNVLHVDTPHYAFRYTCEYTDFYLHLMGQLQQ